MTGKRAAFQSSATQLVVDGYYFAPQCQKHKPIAGTGGALNYQPVPGLYAVWGGGSMSKAGIERMVKRAINSGEIARII